MLAEHVVPVVLRLPGVDQAGLREVGRRTDGETAASLESNVGKGLVKRARRWEEGIEAAAELHAQTAEADTGLVDHAGAEIVSFAQEHGLAQRRNVADPPARPGTGSVERVVA